MQAFIRFSIVFCCVVLLGCQKSSDGASPSVSHSSVSEISEVKNPALQVILNRKSVRKYTEQEISREVLENLLKAGMAAPSSKDRRPWHFIVISDKGILESLGAQLRNATCLQGANKAILVCGDEELSDNCWFLDCAAATQNILIAAESMKLGAVWTSVYPYDDRAVIVNKTFGLQKNIHPFAIVSLGYPSGENTAKNKFDASRIHDNKW